MKKVILPIFALSALSVFAEKPTMLLIKLATIKLIHFL